MAPSTDLRRTIVIFLNIFEEFVDVGFAVLGGNLLVSLVLSLAADSLVCGLIDLWTNVCNIFFDLVNFGDTEKLQGTEFANEMVTT